MVCTDPVGGGVEVVGVLVVGLSVGWSVIGF